MTTQPAMPLDDVLHAFAMAKESPDAETLERFTRQYPDYADALTEFAVELLLDDAIADEPVEAGDGESMSPAVSRAISFFHNAVYDAEKSAATPLRSIPVTRNPFAQLDRTRFRAVAGRLHANNTFMIKLRDRMIEPDTLISRIGFCEKVAEELGEPLDLLIGHFKGEQVIAAGQHFKADEKPALTKRESFEEAVRNSGLSPEQQSYLLGL
jgi:hypothetical protein